LIPALASLGLILLFATASVSFITACIRCKADLEGGGRLGSDFGGGPDGLGGGDDGTGGFTCGLSICN